MFISFIQKRVRLNKVAQREKKYFLNCFVGIYQKIIKLKYRASRFLSVFSYNEPMCLYKRQTHVSNYCKSQLSSDIEKNPGSTPVYIGPGVDKTRNMEHSGTFRNIPEHSGTSRNIE